MAIKLTFDNSTCLSEAVFDNDNQELDVVFRSNGRRHYVYGVGEEAAHALVQASSAGRTFHRLVADKLVRKYEVIS